MKIRYPQWLRAALLLMPLTGLSFYGTAAYAEPLTLRQAIELALAHSTTTAASGADVQRAFASYREVKNQYLPQLMVGSGLGYSYGFPLSVEGSAPSLVNVAAQSTVFNPAQSLFMKAARTEWDKQFSTVSAERDALNARLTSIQIDQAVVTEATKRGLRATAMPDIAARARNTFKLVNGVPQAFEADGQTARVGKDGVTPMTLAEWVDMQVSDAPHLFESNAGGGAAGNGSGGVGNKSVKNPFRKETWNLTEQMKLQKSDPQMAARLKAAA